MGANEAWAIIVGFALPVIVAVIKQDGFSKYVNDMLAFLTCIVGGLGVAYFAGGLQYGCPTWQTCLEVIVIDVALVLTEAFTLYKMFWKPSGIDARITSATSVFK